MAEMALSGEKDVGNGTQLPLKCVNKPWLQDKHRGTLDLTQTFE